MKKFVETITYSVEKVGIPNNIPNIFVYEVVV